MSCVLKGPEGKRGVDLQEDPQVLHLIFLGLSIVTSQFYFHHRTCQKLK